MDSFARSTNRVCAPARATDRRLGMVNVCHALMAEIGRVQGSPGTTSR